MHITWKRCWNIVDKRTILYATCAEKDSLIPCVGHPNIDRSEGARMGRHPLSSLSAATVLALMARRTRPRLTLVSSEESTAVHDIRSIEPERPRDCVFEEPGLDLLGRRQFVATDENSWELDRGVASSDEMVAKVQARLWSVVEAHRARLRPQLMRT